MELVPPSGAVLSVHQVIQRRLLKRPFPGFGVAPGRGQHVPVVVVQLVGRRGSSSPASASPRGTACGAPRTRRRWRGASAPRHAGAGADPRRSDVFEVLVQRLRCQPALEQRLVGHVVRRDAAGILVHQLLEALQAVDGQDVAGRDRAADDFVAADLVVLQRLVDRLAKLLELLLGDLDLLVA